VRYKETAVKRKFPLKEEPLALGRWARWIPWEIAQQAHLHMACKLSLEELAGAGGLSPFEVDQLLSRQSTEEWSRAGGDVLCEKCGLPYYDHPYCPLFFYQCRPYLKRLCDGRLVKL